MLELRRFDLNLLISLDALLHEKNISRAADRLHVSQPAMSAALHKLRDYFNDTLLVRVGRNLQLTPRALSLVEPVREALLRIQATLETRPQFDPATARREFAIIISEEALPDLLPALVKHLAAKAPGIACRVQLISESILIRLEYGEADLCVCLDRLKLYATRAWPDSLRMVRLRPVRWVCAVDAHHPTVDNSLSAEQFFTLPRAFGAPSSYSVSTEELVRRLFDIDVTVHLAVPSLLHLPLVLPGTSYVATLPERVLKLVPPLLPLKSFPTPFHIPIQHELLLWHSRHEPDPAHAWLRELIVQIARELP
jgi:LysR family transcriptional regulator, nod-box dependent transcriptional activator